MGHVLASNQAGVSPVLTQKKIVPGEPVTLPKSLARKIRNARGRMRRGFATRDIGGINVAVLTQATAQAELCDAMDEHRHLKLAFCNAHLVNMAARNEELVQRLTSFLVLADGIGVDLGSRLLHGAAFPENLNGTDFFPQFLATVRRQLRVVLVGGRPGVAERAKDNFARRYPAHDFSVLSHGYFEPEDEEGLLDRLASEPPDLLLVAFGNPLQERWISDRLDGRHCAVAAGVGALLDFFADEIPRAPEWVRSLRMEWAYRLWVEPYRLWRRYILGNPAFMLRILRQRLYSTPSPR